MEGVLAGRLECPDCGAALESLSCDACGRTYDRTDGIYDFVVGDPDGIDALGDAVADRADEMTPAALQRDYESYVTDAEREARTLAGQALTERLTELAGVTVEIATGMGGLFAALLDVDDVAPIATDISIGTLRQLRDQLRQQRGAIESSHSFVACDARTLPFRANSIDAVVSAGGFNNVARSGTALAAAARVLQRGGRLLVLNAFVDPETESAERAAAYDVETAYLRDRFVTAARDAGFGDVTVETVASVEATNNPYDLLPVAGETQTYAVVDCRVGTE